MFICGIDYSISSPAVVKAELDSEYNIISMDYVSFSGTKKVCKTDDKIHINVLKSFSSDLERYQYLRDTISEFMYGNNQPEYVSIEGYAMHGIGKLLNIAEATVLTKQVIFDHNTPLRIYTPSAIKKYATGNGTAGKVSMFEHFIKKNVSQLDLSHLVDLKNPQEDIIDAYWAMDLLLTELKLRAGIIDMKSLSMKQIEVFNAVSKSNPTNILVRDFIQKS